METYILERVYLPTRTLGSIYSPDGKIVCKTLELPWKENKKSVSCIPEGTYLTMLQPPKADRKYFYFRLPVVPGRSGILIHRGTNPTHSKGCILVASRFTNVETMEPILEDSTTKLTWMTQNLPANFHLTIRKK